jgi:cyanophycin synthetase
VEIQDLIIFKGRNIYSHKTVMKMIVDIGEYGNVPTKDIKDFNEKLLSAFPGLKTNSCGLGYEGGFLEKLNAGTYLAHVLEHVILDLQNTLGYDVKYGKTRIIKEPSLYYLIYEYENEITGLECGKAAVFILNYFINDEDIIINEFLEYLKKISLDSELGPSTSAIVAEAKKRNIPITRIGYESLIQLGYGKRSRHIESTLTDATSCISADIASNKQLTKSILNENQIPVPYGVVVYSEISAIMAANEIGIPVVIKPFDGNQGKGVHLNLINENQIKTAFQDASKYSNGIIVESYVTGKDYRILVVGGKVKAVSERLSAAVIGDGRHTIKELIDITNLDERRGDSHEKPLTKIKLDEVTQSVLKKKGLNEEYIPKPDEEIILRENANLSTGGTAIDRTDNIHPNNADIAIRAANAINIDIAGIDIVAEDISKSILNSSGAVVEVNSAPGIRMHIYPSIGQSRNVAKDIVDLLFPDEQSIYFPIVSVTGTNGKTTTTRLISYILSLTGKTVGMTSTSGSFINEKCICKGDNSGPLSAKALLSNKTIDAAVLETARGGLVREGLGYDLADVGVITNVTEDHLGIDGIDTVKDLAFVKSLVVEAVKNDGYAVLNAEDEMTEYILETVRVKVILFYKNRNKIQKFDTSDFIHVYINEGFIVINNGKEVIKVVKVNEIPITYNGLVECNIENCLAAASALFGLKVPVETISLGLKSFNLNLGRFQLFERKGHKVMLDYAHNQAGFEAIIKTCKGFTAKRRVGIIGMPGDRPNEAIEAVGKLCSNAFDKIYIKEDIDLRGRKKREVAKLLYNAIIQNGFSEKNISVFDNEIDALKESFLDEKEGDLMVVLYEKIDPLLELLN